MDIAIFRKLHSISFGAATLLAAASTVRRLRASCGLALRTQVLARTTCITVVAMSARPTTVPVRTAFQSAVSPETSLPYFKRKIRTCACFSFHTIVSFAGLFFS